MTQSEIEQINLAKQLEPTLSNKSVHHKSAPWTKENTFIFIILGCSAIKEQNSGFKKDIKYINYSLVSDAILIKRLGINHLKIDPNHIIIFAHGKENDFNIKSITNEIIIQLTINDIYKTTVKEEDFDFFFYKETKEIQYIIKSSLEGHSDAHIILFLDDYKPPFHFAESPFFDFYLFFLNIQHSSLHILNDSCYSGQTIELLECYYKISESLRLTNDKMSTKDLQFISFIASELQPNKKIEDLRYIFSFIENFYRLDQDEKKDLKNMIGTIYNTIELKHEELFINDLNIRLNDITFSNSVNDRCIVKNIDFLTKIGLSTLHDLSDFYKFIFYFEKTYNIQKDFKLIYATINNIIHPAVVAQNALNCNNSKFYEIIKILSKQNNDFLNYLYERHPDHYLITSSHKEGLSPTFGTRRITLDKKVIGGSPAMSAFIIAVMIFPNENGININQIKSIAYETNDSYYEYAIQSSIGVKEWHRLFFSEWKSSDHANESFIKLNDVNEKTIEEVMNSVGFKLSSRFSNDDFETPINLDSNEKQFGTQTSEKYGFIIQPMNKRKKRCRCRMIKKNQITSFDGYTKVEKEIDPYYSDDSEIKTDVNEKCNIKSSSFILATVSCDERIDINDINYFKENIYKHHRGFATDFAFIFRYELQQLTKDLEYPFNPEDPCNLNISEAKSYLDIIDWMSHFLSPWYLNFELNIIVGQVDAYIFKYKIPFDMIEDLFKRSFNVADQIVTPIYFDQETFKKNRLLKIVTK